MDHPEKVGVSTKKEYEKGRRRSVAARKSASLATPLREDKKGPRKKAGDSLAIARKMDHGCGIPKAVRESLIDASLAERAPMERIKR